MDQLNLNHRPQKNSLLNKNQNTLVTVCYSYFTSLALQDRKKNILFNPKKKAPLKRGALQEMKK
jgi:hypothetical protein